MDSTDNFWKKSFKTLSEDCGHLFFQYTKLPSLTSFFYPLQVRWADLEERKAQMKMRDIGFVVGQTNWNRMLDPSGGSSALTKTKIIPNRHQSEFKNSK